ncbi:DNA repair protein RAD50-like [Populus alba x Populus x berolinensis]|nr:DNA repair protein RAD50-like [Populus alba x Populus x berolinensis]
MSTVDKMLIKGIRSFDPENKHVITFLKPLTLIVGPNGAGKTTIIECLKVACTGELPPNARSGHSFIHDPKVAGETETKGQIKLRFKTAAAKDVVCIRSFQLTQKASKMEYKAIESVLQTINPHTGEKVCLSYRCADMDREIPALMGVSKAILENVIFVHQDEANWPLQDPSTLKKKFDDIFSATRYTKALEVIKKLHKDQAQEIKTYKLKLENLQTLKDAAYKLRESIGQDQEKTEILKVQSQELESNLQNLDAKIHHTEVTLKDMRKLQDQITIKTAERSTLFREQQRQYAALAEENEDTDEELQEWKTKFDEKIASLESNICKLEREMNDMETKGSFLKQNINEYIREISRLQTEAEAHASLKNERDSNIQKMYTRHNLGPLPNAPFGDDVALNLTNRLKSRLVGLDKDLQDKKCLLREIGIIKGLDLSLISVVLLLLCDMAHISGLSRLLQEAANPFEYCDIVTTTTHKSLRGPRAGMIFYRKGPKPPKKGQPENAVYDFEDKVNFAVFPSSSGWSPQSPDRCSGCCPETGPNPWFKAYAKQVKANAVALGNYLMGQGYKLVTEGTENHLVLWDLRPLGLNSNVLAGNKVEKLCDLANITVNKNAVLGDSSALAPGGVRIGTPAMTSKRFGREGFRTDWRVPPPCCDHHAEHPKVIWKALEGLQQGSGEQQGH